MTTTTNLAHTAPSSIMTVTTSTETTGQRQREVLDATKPQETRTTTEDLPSRSRNQQRHPPKPRSHPPPKNLGALVLAVGLGFAAGFLISDGTRKTTGGKRRAPADPDSSRRPRSVSDGDDYWEQRQRLEYRRSSDRLALERRPSFVGRERSMSRSTRCVPEDEVEWDYWR
jgi:hypothetical protein